MFVSYFVQLRIAKVNLVTGSPSKSFQHLMVSPLCCAMSNRGAEEETPASASLFFTLNRAAFWFFSEVTHTVPSSQLHMAARDGAHDHRAGNKSPEAAGA